MTDIEAVKKFLGCLELHHDAWHYRQDEIAAIKGGARAQTHLDEEQAAATLARFERHDGEDAAKVAEFVDAAVQAEQERFQRLIPVLLTWKENQPTETELDQAREDLRAAGITPEYLASLSDQQKGLGEK